MLCKPPPGWLGLHREQRTLAHMMLATKDAADITNIAQAIAVYAIGQTVQAVKRAGPHDNIGATLRLFLAEGRKGTRTYAAIPRITYYCIVSFQ